MFGTFVVTLSSAWLRRYAYLHFAACLDHRMEAQFRRCPSLRGPTRGVRCSLLTGESHVHRAFGIEPNREGKSRCRNRRRSTQCRSRQRYLLTSRRKRFSELRAYGFLGSPHSPGPTPKTFLADLTGDMVLRCYPASSTSFSVFRSFPSW